MTLRLSYLLCFCFLFRFTAAQTFTGGGGAIPDNGSSVDFPLIIGFISPPVIDTVTFGVETVCINLLHTYDADLDISLVAPDGTTLFLTAGNGGGGHNYTNTCFNATAATSIVSGSAPFTGTFRPTGQLGKVNNGQVGYGTWKLHILDTYPFADQGNVISWSITFGNNPAIPSSFSSSNLPLVLINTNGQGIVNNPKITAEMGIINNGIGIRNYAIDPFNDFDGLIGIELRGNSSLGFPQKSYALETRDSLGNNLNVSLLGLPPENDWILYGPYTDKSLIRNVLTFKIANEMGGYASRTVFCELLLNDEYQGVYVLMERIKRDVNRVNIAAMTPNDSTGDALTGGYMMKIDWVASDGWTSAYPPVPPNTQNNTIFIQYVYPKDDSITVKQKNYIQAYVDSMEDALVQSTFANPITGYRKYADAASFIDYYLVNEISKNVDGYRLSTYFYKERNSLGGKIRMGPVWDYNLAWRNADYCNAQSTSGWAYNITNYCQADIPFWFGRMLQDTTYANQLRCRYNQLRTTVLDTAYLFSYIDSVAAYLNEAQQRHYVTWPILGVYVWPNPSPIPTTYAGEISSLKLWIYQRLLWMDSQLPGNCIPAGTVDFYTDKNNVQVFPNPSDGNFMLYLSDQKVDFIEVLDLTGRSVYNYSVEKNRNEIPLNLAFLSKGMYSLVIKSKQHHIFKKIVIQ